MLTGPLTSILCKFLIQCGSKDIRDAIAPVLATESLDMDVLFKAGRYDESEGDYLNIPLDKQQYEFYRLRHGR